ncbi:MAG: M24 family metallopeptidase [Xanthobacteraceae bacterium]
MKRVPEQGRQASAATGDDGALDLVPELLPVFEQSFPRFSNAEYARRGSALARAMERAGVDHVLLVCVQGVGNGVRWLTSWPGTNEALLIFRPGEPMVMYVEYCNHVPQARALTRETDVRWGEQQGIVKVCEELDRQAAKRVGVIGPLSGVRWKTLEERFQIVSLDSEYVGLRMRKSDEEIDWLRIGAALSDAGMCALIGGTRPGMSEHDLANIIERAYVGLGGTHGIHFIGSTSMAAPNLCVPRQFPSRRKLRAGDFVFCEFSASWWDYSGQVLRGFTVEAEPNSLYQDLHATAVAAYEDVTKVVRPGAVAAELIEASSTIEANGFTTCDDLVHGYGGGYLPPIVGSQSRPARKESVALAENMCVVVQPNVSTRDYTAGVQVGNLLRVTSNGCESLQRIPLGFFRAGQAI